jgi:hypothetical protein
MKIGLFSDIHLEHRPSNQWEVVNRLIETSQGCDLVVNAGDTHHEIEVREGVKKSLRKTGAQYISVMGNHDFYGNDWHDNNFNQVIDLEAFGFGSGKKILHGTMWTNFDNSELVEHEAWRCISDFRWINGLEGPHLMHRKFNRFLEMVESEKPDIVVSHFAPHPGSIHPRWAGAMLNGYFCPNALDRLTHKPKLWLHGHIHDPVDYVHKGGTRVVANPLGYPGETYKDISQYQTKVIEIE